MLLEEALSLKTGLGATYRFAYGTLEVKQNQFGIRGIFARTFISAGTEIISVPIKDGSLTHLRAFEEASGLLLKLGSDRFNLPQHFILACALYLRFKNTARRDSDLFVTEKDVATVYRSSPMTATGSRALQDLIHYNDKSRLELGTKTDQLIENLNVEEHVFRALLGYCSSRMFSGFGIIPVLDWWNASYGPSVNCSYECENEHLKFMAQRDIEVGEELTWQYNSGNRADTWLTYGYVDNRRPATASVPLSLTKAERLRYEAFLSDHLDIPAHIVNPPTKVDPSLFVYTLSLPGELTLAESNRLEIAQALDDFVTVRAWVRAYVLSSGMPVTEPISIVNLQSHHNIYGLEVEVRALSTIQEALASAKSATRDRVEAFTSTAQGRFVDMMPYIKIVDEANDGWTSILEDILALLHHPNPLAVLNPMFELDAKSLDGAIATVKSMDRDSPRLRTAVILSYLGGFGQSIGSDWPSVSPE